MTTRIKIISTGLKTREEVERLVRETAKLQLLRESSIIERDQEIAAVSNKHNKYIDGYGLKIESNMALIEQWASVHPEEFPKDSRSLVIDGNRLGYRLGQPQPKPMKKLTWKAVAERIKKAGAKFENCFIRTKEEVNKEAILAARMEEGVLETIGIEIVQAETFYLDPNREGQPEKRLTTEVGA